MISKLVLENFKAHKYTEIDLAPGITTIIGSSEAGKTCIAKALRWLVENRPLSESDVRREGTKKSDPVVVRVWLGEGKSVERRRQSKFNGYRIYSQDGSLVAEFGAIKGDVPAEVRDLLALESSCFQHQYDPYFLLQESAGEVARKFNQAADIGAIDALISYLKSEGRHIDRELTETCSLLSQAEESRGDYAMLGSGERLIKSAQQALAFLDEANAFKAELGQLVFKAKNLEVRMAQAGQVLPPKELLNKGTACAERIRKLRSEAQGVSLLVEQALSLRNRLSSATVKQKEAEEAFEQALVNAKRCPLCGSVIKRKERLR